MHFICIDHDFLQEINTCVKERFFASVLLLQYDHADLNLIYQSNYSNVRFFLSVVCCKSFGRLQRRERILRRAFAYLIWEEKLRREEKDRIDHADFDLNLNLNLDLDIDLQTKSRRVLFDRIDLIQIYKAADLERPPDLLRREEVSLLQLYCSILRRPCPDL